MANLGQGLAGAGAGFASGGPVGGVLGLLQGIFGGGSHEDPNLRAMRQQQQGIANQLLQYGSSVPGSSPDELFNLSQARGNLGVAQRQNQQRAFAAFNPNQGLPASQMLANLGNANIAQQMSLQSGLLQDASANRRQALQQAALIGQGAAGLYQPHQSQLGQMLAQLSQAYAYRQKQQQLGQADGTDDTNPAGVSGELGRLGAGGGALPGSNPYWGLGGSSQAAEGTPALLPGQNPYFAGLGDDPSMAALLALLMGHPQGGAPGAAPSAIPGAVGDDPYAAAMQQMMTQQGIPGASQPSAVNAAPNAAPGLQGSMSPGNQSPGGMNGTMNQIRQSAGFGRVLTLPNGVRLPY